MKIENSTISIKWLFWYVNRIDVRIDMIARLIKKKTQKLQITGMKKGTSFQIPQIF